MAVQTTVTTAYRSHAVEGFNGFVSMRTSVAYRRGRFGCRIGANQVVGLLTGEASGFFGSGVTWWIRAFFVHGPDVPALGTAVHTLGSSRQWSWLGTTHHPVCFGYVGRLSERGQAKRGVLWKNTRGWSLCKPKICPQQGQP
jgi:hypothetical protein